MRLSCQIFRGDQAGQLGSRHKEGGGGGRSSRVEAKANERSGPIPETGNSKGKLMLAPLAAGRWDSDLERVMGELMLRRSREEPVKSATKYAEGREVC